TMDVTEIAEEVEYRQAAQTATRIQAIIRVTGNNDKTEAGIGKPGEGNFWDFRHNRVRIDPVDLGRHENAWRGITGHEGMHVRITRAKESVPVEVWNNPGLNNLLQSIEDVRVNEGLCRMFPGAEAWIRQAMTEEGADGGRMDLETPASQVLKRYGYIPFHIEYIVELRKIWTHGTRSTYLSPEVTEALDNTQDAAFRAAYEIPTEDASEDEIIASAKRSFAITEAEIIPEYQKLIELDKETEEIRQQLLFLISEQGSDNLDILRLDLTEEENKELDELIEKARLFSKQKEDSETIEDEDKTGFIKLSKLSEGLKQKLSLAKEQSNQEVSDKLDSETEKVLKDISDIITKILRAQLMDPKENPTFEEMEIEKEEIESLQEATEQIKASDANKPTEREYETVDYETISAQVRPYVDDLVESLNEVLIPNKFPRWRRGYPDGERVNLPDAMRFDVDKTVHERMWERLSIPERRDFRFTFLIDRSGSMEVKAADGKLIQKLEESTDPRDADTLSSMPTRMDLAKQVAVLSADSFDRLGIKFEELSYSGTYDHIRNEEGDYEAVERLDMKILHPYNEKFGAASKESIAKGLEPEDMTPTGAALAFAAERQNEDLGTQNFIIIITDGTPNNMLNFKATLEKLKAEGNQHVIGVLMGKGLERLKDQFDNAIVAEDMTQLVPMFSDLISDIVKNPQAYL
ncbi:hypothetical protein KAZ57_00180, partial [Patescibacteria group bacterium]|nr:hypothetical protein [Patescibacteria group bacterium]